MSAAPILAVAWRSLRWLAPLVVACALAACGGGGNYAAGGIVGTGSAPIVAVGTITGFGDGTVAVTAQQFSLAGASVTINGQAATAGALKVGMVVAVEGDTLADGTRVARSIAYRAEARGVVDGVDTTAGTFSVLGQVVPVNSLTVFDGGTFATLVSQYVEVSGYRSDPGEVVATRVEIHPTFVAGVTPLQVTGTVASLDAPARTLAIGAQTVDFSLLAPAQVPSGLANGASVAATGTALTTSGALLATSLAIVAPTPPAATGTALEVEGYVTDFASVASFKVNGQPVNATGATATGGSLDMIANGAKLEVEGRLANGVLVASTVTFEDVPTITLDGLVDSIDTGSQKLVIASQTVAVGASTQFEDLSAAAVRNFAFSSIAVGDRLTVRAVRTTSGLFAQRIVRRDRTAPPPSDPPAEVEGPITAFTSIADFVVGAQRVNANSATFSGGSASSLAVGVRVHAQGTQSNDVLIASTVAILPPDPAPPTDIEVTGTIQAFVSIANFQVGGQTVDAMAAQFVNGTAADLANGRFVDVKGTVNAGILHASVVEFQNVTPPPPATVDADGTIANYVSLSSFSIAGQPVDASSAHFTHGGPSDVQNGRTGHAHGPLVNGVLRAATIAVDDPPGNQSIELEGQISNFVSVSQFTVAGRTVDASAATFSNGTASQLANGKRVEIHGRLVNNVVKASSVAFDD